MTPHDTKASLGIYRYFTGAIEVEIIWQPSDAESVAEALRVLDALRTHIAAGTAHTLMR